MAKSEINIGDLVEYGGIICQVSAVSQDKKSAVIKNGKSIYEVKIQILTKIN